MKLRFFCFFLLSLLICNCTQNKNNVYKETEQVKAKLVWPPSIKIRSSSNVSHFHYIISINLYCEACLSEFLVWEDLLSEYNTDSIDVNVIVTGHNDAFLSYVNSSQVLGNFCIYDENNLFYDKNQIEYNENRSFVMDSQNTIVFRGSLLFDSDFNKFRSFLEL